MMDVCKVWNLFILVKWWDVIEIEVVLCKVFVGWLCYLFYFVCSFWEVWIVVVCDVVVIFFNNVKN